jgi:hypothetical protein
MRAADKDAEIPCTRTLQFASASVPLAFMDMFDTNSANLRTSLSASTPAIMEKTAA